MNVAEMRAECTRLKASIRALTQERDHLSPQAINGDARGPSARARIAAIDAERAALISSLETFEAALRAHKGNPRLADRFEERMAAIDATYHNKKPRLQQQLVQAIERTYRHVAANAASLDLTDKCVEAPDNVARKPVPTLIPLAAVARAYAAHLTGEGELAESVKGTELAAEHWHSRSGGMTGLTHDNTQRLDQLRRELAIRQGHTNDLLATTVLPSCPSDPKAFVLVWGTPPISMGRTNRGRGMGRPERV